MLASPQRDMADTDGEVTLGGLGGVETMAALIMFGLGVIVGVGIGFMGAALYVWKVGKR